MSFFGEIIKGIAGLTMAGMAALHGAPDQGTASNTPLFSTDDKGALIEHLEKGTSTRPTLLKSQGEILTTGIVGTTSTSTFSLKVKDGSLKKILTDATTTISVQNGSTTITKTKDLIFGGRVLVVGTPVSTSTISASSVTGGTVEIRKGTDTHEEGSNKKENKINNKEESKNE